MKRSYSLQQRLGAGTVLVSLLGLLGSAIFYYIEVYSNGDDLHMRTLQSQARELRSAIRVDNGGNIRLDLPDSWRAVYSDTSSGFLYAVYRPDGRVAAASSNSDISLRAPDQGMLGKLYFSGVGRERVVMFAQSLEPGYVLVVGRQHAEEEVLVDSLLGEDFEHLVVVLVPLVLAMMLLGWAVVGLSLRPLRRASAEAAAIGPGNASARIGVEDMPEEVKPLVNAVNGALARLGSAYAAERRFTADAAHELRTPLAALALRLEQARLDGQTDWPAIERDMAQLRRLVTQLLELARKESGEAEGERGAPADVNVARLAREVAALLLPLAEQNGRDIVVLAPEAAFMPGHSEDLRDMLRNLIENAIVHGNGTVRVSVEDGDEISIEVRDEGSGVSDELAETVFRRFYKGSPTSPGAGLGLAIVRQVVRSHGGEVGFVPDRCCRVRVTLPRTHALRSHPIASVA